jgi:hypothetical protein
MSPYAYCANNPVGLVDLTGDSIKFAPGVSAEFKEYFKAAVQYMRENKLDGKIARLQASPNVYYLAETSSGNSSFSQSTMTITWDPTVALFFEETGVTLSPTTILSHEFSHAEGYENALKKYYMDCRTIGVSAAKKNFEKYFKTLEQGSDKQYDTKEERRVITGPEQHTAKQLGEIKEGEVTRTKHTYSKDEVKVIRVKDVRATKSLEE